MMQDNIESGSVSKVVDCILGLKAYHDGFYKHIKTPPFQLSATKVNHSLCASKTSRQLDRTDCTDGESDQIKGNGFMFHLSFMYSQVEPVTCSVDIKGS